MPPLIQPRPTLPHQVETDPNKDHLLCAESLRGLLFGHPVLLVTTGIGHDRAALCLSGILDYYGPYVKEIMFIGTGGFSPAAGGILNSGECLGSKLLQTCDFLRLPTTSYGFLRVFLIQLSTKSCFLIQLNIDAQSPTTHPPSADN